MLPAAGGATCAGSGARARRAGARSCAAAPAAPAAAAARAFAGAAAAGVVFASLFGAAAAAWGAWQLRAHRYWLCGSGGGARRRGEAASLLRASK